MERHIGRVSVLDLISKYRALLYSTLVGELHKKGKGMDFKNLKKVMRSFKVATKRSNERYLRDMKKYHPKLAADLKKKSFKYYFTFSNGLKVALKK